MKIKCSCTGCKKELTTNNLESTKSCAPSNCKNCGKLISKSIFCSKSCSRTFSNLNRVFTEETLQKMSNSNTGKKYPNRKRVQTSEETKNLLSQLASNRLKQNSSYSKRVEYLPGIILESSYEVLTATVLDELKIKWIKVRKGFIWNDNGKIRRYIPDFYLPEYDIFLDPKNSYLIQKDQTKINSAMQLNNIKVFILPIENITKEYMTTLCGIERE